MRKQVNNTCGYCRESAECLYQGYSEELSGTFKLTVFIQLFRERLSEKKHNSARDKTERWYGYILEFCILAYRNAQVCIFECEEFVFPLRRPFSVAFLLGCRMYLSFENNSSKSSRG